MMIIIIIHNTKYNIHAYQGIEFVYYSTFPKTKYYED